MSYANNDMSGIPSPRRHLYAHYYSQFPAEPVANVQQLSHRNRNPFEQMSANTSHPAHLFHFSRPASATTNALSHSLAHMIVHACGERTIGGVQADIEWSDSAFGGRSRRFVV